MASFAETIDNDCNCVVEDLMFVNSFGSRNYTDKLNIISKGRPTPLIPTLYTVTKQRNRYLKKENYEAIPWLCGCVKLKKLFCWPCLLFSSDNNIWTRKGVTDLNNLHNLQRRHELSKCHIISNIALKQFGKTRIEIGLSEQIQLNKDRHNELVRQNRYILSRLIDAACFLGKNELSFHERNVPAILNEGNYVELVKLLRSIDKEFDAYLQRSTVFKSLSNDIQNDLIQCVSEIMISEIKKELLYAQFVAIILDKTTDVTNKCQVSTVLRFVNEDAEVSERFLGYNDFTGNLMAATLANQVFSILKEYKCERKLIAQAYDGAVTGNHCLQQKVKSKFSQALFVHCYGHRLDLILRNSVDHIKECKIFFTTLSGLCMYFSKTSKRTCALSQEIKEILTSEDTRWNHNSKLVCTVMDRKDELVGLFKSIIEQRDQWDVESYNGAKGFLSTLQDFDFNFMLKLFSSLLPQAKLIFENLQEKISDTDYCLEQINKFETYLEKMKNDYNAFWLEVTIEDTSGEHCSKNNNFETFLPKIKSEYDTFWSEEMLQDNSEEHCSKRQKVENIPGKKEDAYRELFYEIIDTIKSELSQRFSDINQLNFLELLDSSKFQEFSLKFPEQQFACLKKCYRLYFEFPRLKSELEAIYSNTQFCRKTVHEFFKCLHIGELDDILPQVCKLLNLVVTIPTTIVPSTKLHRIKTYFYNCHTENRPSTLPLLSIEKALLSSLKVKPNFYNDVIDLFAKKPRRIELLYY